MKRTLLGLAAAIALVSALAADMTPRSPIDNGVVLRFRDMGDGTWAETVAPQGTAASGAADTGNPIKVGGRYNSTTPTLTDGQRGDLQLGTRGSLKIQLMTPDAGTVINGQAVSTDGLSSAITGLVTASVNLIWNGTALDRVAKANAVARLPSAAATTNATVAKASGGTVHVIQAYNSTAGIKYLKLYNKATAPTVGTDTPFRTIALGPNQQMVVQFPFGLYFSTGISYALTGGPADGDTTALVASDVVGLNIDYN